MKKLHLSKISDFTSASLSVGDGYLQIDLEPDHRRLVIRAGELGKLSRVHVLLLLSQGLLFFSSLLERVFRRGKWLGRQYYELGSLVNLYLRARKSSVSGNTLPIELLQERIERVLRYYNLRVLRGYRLLARSSPLLSDEYLDALGEFLYHQLGKLFRRYRRQRTLRELLRAARKGS